MFWEDVVDENELEIGNDGEATHHWATGGHEGRSVINLTFAHSAVTKSFIPGDDHATGSDHKVPEWELEVARQQAAGHERVIGWNLAAMTEEDAKAAERLWMELA